MHRVGTIVFVLVAMFGTAASHASTLTVYLSPPGAMSSEIPNVTTETFNDPALLNSVATSYQSVIGQYSVANGYRIPVISYDQYGGAGNSDYLYVGTRRTGDATSVTLDLAAPADYFGFWWSAGDPLNRISVYRQGVLVAQFQTSDITTLLASSPLIALNGTNYLSSSYYGNPNTGSGSHTGQDSGEPFAYVNLVADGFMFDSLVLDNNGTSGFETDNQSVSSNPVNIPQDFGSFVKVTDLSFSSPVPEPSYAALGGLLLATLLYKGRGRRP